MGDLKLYECPLTVITQQTWEIIKLVNDTVTSDYKAENTCLLVKGAWLDQPTWYRQAVSIVRTERMTAENKRIKKQNDDLKKQSLKSKRK